MDSIRRQAPRSLETSAVEAVRALQQGPRGTTDHDVHRYLQSLGLVSNQSETKLALHRALRSNLIERPQGTALRVNACGCIKKPKRNIKYRAAQNCFLWDGSGCSQKKDDSGCSKKKDECPPKKPKCQKKKPPKKPKKKASPKKDEGCGKAEKLCCKGGKKEVKFCAKDCGTGEKKLVQFCASKKKKTCKKKKKKCGC